MPDCSCLKIFPVLLVDPMEAPQEEALARELPLTELPR